MLWNGVDRRPRAPSSGNVNVGNTTTFRRPWYGEVVHDNTLASVAIARRHTRLQSCGKRTFNQEIAYAAGPSVERCRTQEGKLNSEHTSLSFPNTLTRFQGFLCSLMNSDSFFTLFFLQYFVNFSFNLFQLPDSIFQ